MTVGAGPPTLACETAAVVVALRESARLHAAIASVRAAGAGRDMAVVCVLNDPAATGFWTRDGVRYVGTGMNLGWAGGVHAGLLGVDCTYVWALQDDLLVSPGSLDTLAAALEADPALGTVRPLAVDASGMVARTGLGAWIGPDGTWIRTVLDRPTPASVLSDPPVGDFVLSSGQLVRRAAWDAVGGFDPYFFPWGYVDIDFSRTLTATGWRFANVGAARMAHPGGGSTSTLFRELSNTRNRYLYEHKWSDGDLPDDPRAPVSTGVVARAREGRAAPRDTGLAALSSAVGIAAADFALGSVRWLADDAPYRSVVALGRDAALRRRTAARAVAGLRRRLDR